MNLWKRDPSENQTTATCNLQTCAPLIASEFFRQEWEVLKLKGSEPQVGFRIEKANFEINSTKHYEFRRQRRICIPGTTIR